MWRWRSRYILVTNWGYCHREVIAMANKEPKMGEIVYLGQRRQQKLQQEAKQQKQQQRVLLQMRVVRWLYGALTVCLVLAVVLWQQNNTSDFSSQQNLSALGVEQPAAEAQTASLSQPTTSGQAEQDANQAQQSGEAAANTVSDKGAASQLQQQQTPAGQSTVADQLTGPEAGQSATAEQLTSSEAGQSIAAGQGQTAEKAGTLAANTGAGSDSQQQSWAAAQTGAALSAQSQVALAQPEWPSQEEESSVGETQIRQQLQQPASGTWSRLYGYGYDDTWQDYRFHQGVDMELPQGSEVSAVGSGTVLAVRQDPVQGTLVELDLGGGMVATYGGLEPRQGLAAGDQVTAGEVIGFVAASPVDEAGQPPHIHLEIQVNGAASDPLTMLQE